MIIMIFEANNWELLN